MASAIKIRVASKIDKNLYETMLKNINVSETEVIINEIDCKIYYDIKTKMIGYHEQGKCETFLDLNVYTVEDFYYNCETDYDMYFFEDEEKIKKAYIKWFDKNIYDYTETKEKQNSKVSYDNVISELRLHINASDYEKKLKKEGIKCVKCHKKFLKHDIYQTSNGMKCDKCSK